jgi:hypothetical protein
LYSAIKVNCITGLWANAAVIERRKKVKKIMVNFFIRLKFDELCLKILKLKTCLAIQILFSDKPGRKKIFTL